MGVLIGVVAVGCGAFEVWPRITALPAEGCCLDTWFTTRWIVLALVLTAALLVWRLIEVTRVSRHLGRRQGLWRQRLHDVQGELQDVQRHRSVRDRADQLRNDRDQVVREVLDEILVHASLDTGVDDEACASKAMALDALKCVRDSLDLIPRTLAQAFEQTCECLERRVSEVGGQLRWSMDSQARGEVLSAVDTLRWQRIVAEAVMAALDVEAGRRIVTIRLDVMAGETGRHLQLALGTANQGVERGPLTMPTKRREDLFGMTTAPIRRHSMARLQRQVTALGAQLALEARATQWMNFEVVMPLRGR